jgi:hypothetical protein
MLGKARTTKGSLLLGAAAALATLTLLGGVVLADDGGLMQRVMGHDAYTAMVDQMRGVLGNERADQMIQDCEATMSSGQGGATTGSATGTMMTGMGSRMGSGR